MIGFKVMPLQSYIPIKFCHHVECKLTAKLTSTTIRPTFDGSDLSFLFEFLDKKIIQCKACITAVVVLKCHQSIAFTCNFVVFFCFHSKPKVNLNTQIFTFLSSAITEEVDGLLS